MLKINLLLIYISFLTAVNCHAQPAQNSLTPKVKKSIDQLFKAYDHPNTPGYAIGIIKGTKVMYTHGYGAANLDYELPITPNSTFDIASVSKQFTAACIALLIIDGKLTLETPASTFIPELAKYKDTIRIKHLIYNTSGITDYFKLPRPDGHSWITFNYFDIDYSIKTSLSKDTLAFKPGSRWDYSNVNFMLLTKVVEKISGTSFALFCKERLFGPLGMTHTLINDDVTEVVKNRVTPYNVRSKVYVDAYRKEGINIKTEGNWIQHPRNSPHYGGSGVATTVNDLLKWSQNFFTHKFGGDRFYELMHLTLKFDHDRSNQAFGLYTDTFKTKKYWGWDGGDYGISTQLIRFPDQHVAIVVLSNIGSGEAFKRANEIAEVLIANKIL